MTFLLLTSPSHKQYTLMLLDREINRILKEEIGKLVSEMKSNLDKAGKGSSDLKNSIKSKVSSKGSAEVSMNEYGQYIDKGVSSLRHHLKELFKKDREMCVLIKKKRTKTKIRYLRQKLN